VVLKNVIEFFPISLSHDSIIAPLKDGLYMPAIHFTSIYHITALSILHFIHRASGVVSPKIKGGTKNLGGQSV